MSKVFVVLLDGSSIIASSKAIREPDGSLDGVPFWLCTEVDASGPLLRVLPVPQSEAHPPARETVVGSVYLHYHAVLGIVESTAALLPRFGFGPG